MFPAEYSNSVQKPTEIQHKTEFIPHRCPPREEIIVSAYEPRFGITAFGTSDGRLLAMNKDRVCIASKQKVGEPICALVACTNSSSFLGVSSRDLYEKSPCQLIPRELCPGFSAIKPRTTESIISHWIVKPDEIYMRTAKIKFSVVSVAISPSHPHFAIMAMSDGSIMGWSIEGMKFTELYVNNYEQRGIKAVAIQRGLNCYICSDIIEQIKLNVLEASDMVKLSVSALDVIHPNAAIITDDGQPILLRNWKKSVVLPKIQDHVCVHVKMITADSWIAIFRGAKGDIIFMNEEERVRLDNDFVLINPMVVYEDPFARTGLKALKFFTVKGNVVDISGQSSSLYYPDLRDYLGFGSGNDVYFYKQDGDKIAYHKFRGMTYVGSAEFTASPPFAGKNGTFLAVKDNAVHVYNPTDRTEQMMLPLPAPVKDICTSKTFVDIILEDGVVLSSDMKEGGWAFHDLGVRIPPNAVAWRRVTKSDGTKVLAYVDDAGQLVLEDKVVKVLDKKEQLVSLEVVDHTGRVTDEGAFIMVITDCQIKLFEPNKLKNMKKRKLKEKPLFITYTNWNSMIVRGEKKVEIIALPDVSADSLGTMSLSDESNLIITDGGSCMMLFEKQHTYMYSTNHTTEVLFGDNVPVLEEAPEVVKRLFGSTTKPKATLQETDDSFKFKRGASSLSQTKDIMQELLVTALERGEKLQEMQIKAEKLMLSARKFAENARRFKK